MIERMKEQTKDIIKKEIIFFSTIVGGGMSALMLFTIILASMNNWRMIIDFNSVGEGAFEVIMLIIMVIVCMFGVVLYGRDMMKK